jgi:hypothetical protein
MIETSIETSQQILEKSFGIAWDYLAATGELGMPDDARQFLADSIEVMMTRGERRPLLLANRTIDDYRRWRASRGLARAS